MIFTTIALEKMNKQSFLSKDGCSPTNTFVGWAISIHRSDNCGLISTRGYQGMNNHCAERTQLKRELSAAIAMTLDFPLPKVDDPSFVERRDAHRRVINTKCAIELHLHGCQQCQRTLEIGSYTGEDA